MDGRIFLVIPVQLLCLAVQHSERRVCQLIRLVDPYVAHPGVVLHISSEGHDLAPVTLLHLVGLCRRGRLIRHEAFSIPSNGMLSSCI